MTAETFLKAKIVDVCWREASQEGGCVAMLAVACVLANRVTAGWGDWMTVLQTVDRKSAPDPWAEREDARTMDLSDDDLNTLFREVEDIFHGVYADDITAGMDGAGRPVRALYWCFVDRSISQWFTENIIRRPEDHPRIAQQGMMQLFG